MAEQPGTSRIRPIFLLAAVLAAVAGSSTIFVSRRRPSRETVHSADSDVGSPYLNTRAGVNAVGDAVCARCHGEIAQAYRKHPMGQSLSPIASAPATGQDDGSGRVLFEAQGLAYSIEKRGGRVIHQETRRDTRGRIIARNEAQVQFAVGSGRQGVGYLIERDGFLFQSPINWYAQARRWDLSPNYDKVNFHFNREIVPDCLFCHANRVEPVDGTVNRYRQPIFQGHAIGCERCHGPGALHAHSPRGGGGRDLTIVNPAALEPSLRDAVCEQCHLIGHERVVRLERRAEDYRPGLPFYRFWTVIEWSADSAENRLVGQVEQMHEARCFRASGGRLGCISCHDPHQLPPRGAEAVYYRERCLECHADRGCRLPATDRLALSRADDCVNCHMPRSRSSDILHVAVTNHRITRQAGSGRTQGPRAQGEADRPAMPAADPSAKPRTVVSFHDALLDERERAATERDIGVALCRDGRMGAVIAAPLLEAALAARPDDVAASEALGFALGELGRGEEALAALRTALARQPSRESALAAAAHLAARLGRRDDAIAWWRRAIAIAPWQSRYHAALAPLLFQARDWRGAADACREALRLNPPNLQARELLVRCALRLHDRETAGREFQTLLGFDPPNGEELVRSFSALSGNH
jgi:Flp pilus assembly protein TadD